MAEEYFCGAYVNNQGITFKITRRRGAYLGAWNSFILRAKYTGDPDYVLIRHHPNEGSAKAAGKALCALPA